MTPEKCRELVARLRCPIDRDANPEFREQFVDWGMNDREFGLALKERCAADRIFWANSTWVTKDPMWNPKIPVMPLILYPLQADFVLAQQSYWRDGYGSTLLKSRAQGGTIVPAYNVQGEWQFVPGSDFYFGSEKKEKLDGKSFNIATFPKIDFNLKHQPEFLMPAGYMHKKPCANRLDMHIINSELENVLKAETCNATFAAGGRAVGAIFDEAGLVEVKKPGMLAQIHTSIGMVTSSTLYVSSPRGLNYFKALCDNPALKHHVWHWTDNPDWLPPGCKMGIHCDWLRRKLWPSEWLCSSGCKIHPLGGMPHSPRYDKACENLGDDPVKAAQELDLDWAKSGDPMFDPDMGKKVIAKLKERAPVLEFVSLAWKKDSDTVSSSEGFAYFKAAKRWGILESSVEKLEKSAMLRTYRRPRWCRNPKCVCQGTGLHTHIFCGDCCKGLPHGDNNIGYMLDLTAGLVCAEYASKHDPLVFGEHAAMMCRWYGKGSGYPKDALAGVEWNGPGDTVNKLLALCGIPTHWHISSDTKRKIPDKRGVVLSRQGASRYAMIMEHLIPNVGRAQANGYPFLIVPFREFWVELDHIVKYILDQGILNPEDVKVGGQSKLPDDRPMALLSGLITASTKRWKLRGHIRRKWLPDPERSGVAWDEDDDKERQQELKDAGMKELPSGLIIPKAMDLIKL